MKKNILITLGDPAGIGPYITVKSILSLGPQRTNFTIIGDSRTLKKIKNYGRIKSYVRLIDIQNAESLKSGCASYNSGKAAFGYLQKAVAVLRQQRRAALVTGPVSKEAIQLVKKDFKGHTEFLAKSFSVKKFAMMMVGRKLRLVFLTRHVLVRKISGVLGFEEIKNTLELTYHSLKELFKITQPRIGLCSLNPHAGIDTYVEKEEHLLLKAKNSLGQISKNFLGPYPSDTLFNTEGKKIFDAIVVFYHDQGMIPFKSLEFSCGVNLTLGLPFIRTSPAHGPAFDLVGKKSAIDCRPMQEAIKLAARLSS